MSLPMLSVAEVTKLLPAIIAVFNEKEEFELRIEATDRILACFPGKVRQRVESFLIVKLENETEEESIRIVSNPFIIELKAMALGVTLVQDILGQSAVINKRIQSNFVGGNNESNRRRLDYAFYLDLMLDLIKALHQAKHRFVLDEKEIEKYFQFSASLISVDDERDFEEITSWPTKGTFWILILSHKDYI